MTAYIFLIMTSACVAPTVLNTITPVIATSTPISLASTIETTVTPTTVVPNRDALTVFRSLSPDLRWTATTKRIWENEIEKSIFRVSNDHDTVVWEVENTVFVDEHPGGFSFPVPWYWSKDGRYLYYLHQSSGDGCYGGNTHGGDDLKKLDLATGNVEQISSGGRYVSMSPDERYIATLSFAASGLTILDLTSHTTRTLDFFLNQPDLGMELDQRYITWAPTSQELVFVIMAGVCDGGVESYYNWIVKVDIKSNSQKLLTEKDDQGFVPITWFEPDKILVRDKQGVLWWMNPNDGSTQPIN